MTIEPPSGSAAIAVGLTATTIDISGLVSAGGAGTTSLVANAGTIGESGTLIAGMLSGSATNGDVLQAVSLLGASNQIPTLGSFAASDFMLDDGPSLIVTGPLVAGKSAAIVDAGALLVSGTISPPPGTSAIAVGLTAATIDIPGSVSDGGAGTTSSVANAGTIAENGSVMSGTLSGSATGAANFSERQQSDQRSEQLHCIGPHAGQRCRPGHHRQRQRRAESDTGRCQDNNRGAERRGHGRHAEHHRCRHH